MVDPNPMIQKPLELRTHQINPASPAPLPATTAASAAATAEFSVRRDSEGQEVTFQREKSELFERMEPFKIGGRASL